MKEQWGTSAHSWRENKDIVVATIWEKLWHQFSAQGSFFQQSNKSSKTTLLQEKKKKKKKRKPGRGISKNPVRLKTADLKKALSRNKQKIAGLIQNDVIYQKSNNNISDKIKV